MNKKIVAIRIIAETEDGDKLYLREDLGIIIDLSIEQSLKEKVEGCGFATDWLE